MDSGESATIGDGRYAIDRRIGVGGCGAVYLCYDTVLNRWVAIKRVEPDGGISDPFREARQLASLQHQNIVMVYDFFRTDGDVFVVMEYVAGQNLNELTEPMDLEFFTTFAKQALEGLTAAHAIGMVHRDIKPANIMLAGTPSGGFQTKLLDFGLAKVMSEPSHQTMDHAGAITGSIHTISPEQLSRQPMDHRADLYSLGCVFYKALTMRFPFHGDDVPSLIAAHLQHDFTPLAELRPDLPRGLASWVEKLFAYNQDDRPQSAAEALLDLDRPANKPAASKRPDTSGKPSFATQSPAKKTAQQPPLNPESPPAKAHTPFHHTQNFVIAMVALIAVCATIAILALTGNFGGGGARPNPFAKKEKPTPTPAERTAFKSTERGEIKDMAGKQITITGDIDHLELDDKGRYLIFKDSDPRRDVMLFFDKVKTETSEWMLKRKFAGQKVKATGTVKLDGSRLLLELNSMDDLKLHTDDPAPAR
jgi:serine/threonine protein kinase